MRVGIPIADLCAGLFAAQGIFIALLERAHSDQGQWVQTSLLQAQMFMLDFQAARYLMDGDIAKQAGNNHPTSIPTGVFVTSDGYMNIAVAGELIWERFAAALGHKDWITNPDYATGPDRSKNRDTLNAAITSITGTKTTAEWIDILNKAGVPAGEINNIGQAFENPQVKHLGLAQPVKSHERGDTHLVGQPIMMSRTPSHLAAPPPLAGGHGEDILSTLGYSAAEIAALRRDKII